MSQDLTAVDFFCGAGGSSTGLVQAGVIVRGAANHWPLAIETHNTNHPSTEHFIDDLQQAHPSWYPYADIAWFSPECTNHSLAKGRKRASNQKDFWDNTFDPEAERSRATMREVVEFSAYHSYQVVIVENVVDVRKWQFYDVWLKAMTNMGYDHQILYMNAQFFGVPQSRDRFYAVFWKRGNRAPNLEFTPPATCLEHGRIEAVQAWKNPEFQWGKYGNRRQYIYICPHCTKEVMPDFRPAAEVVDWNIPSPLIRDREKELQPKTIQRILAGLRKFGVESYVMDMGHTHAADEGKVKEISKPMPTQTTRQNLAFITSQHDRKYGAANSSIDNPLPAVTTFNNEHQLVTIPPFRVIMKNSYSKDGRYTLPPKSLDEPLSTIATASQEGLVTPPFLMAHYSNAVYTPIDKPMSTVAGVAKHYMITPEELLPDCGFRMLEWWELQKGMAFPDDYTILGNKRQKVKQIGNAVCPPVAHIIAQRCVESLA